MLHRTINDELSVLETVFDILKPISYLTDALACKKQITASAIYETCEKRITNR